MPAEGAQTTGPDDGIGAEAPIRTASEDRLRRAGFADRVAGVLSELSLREGRVFAIRGEWGFGKSSFKNLIAERLDARDDGADWLDFRPWQWGDGDSITRALFGQIADRLGGDYSREALARADALRRYGDILTGAGEPLKKAGNSPQAISIVLTNASVIAVASALGFELPAVAKVAAGLAIISVVVLFVGRVLSHLGRDRSAEPLDKVRAALEARLRGLRRPLVVFVDDIERLEPEEIRTLLRQIKANANLPNIVFVLLFQASIVESALDPVSDGDGRAYLEKVVQASFDLPAIPVGVVHRLFAKELSVLAEPYATEANGFSSTRWGNAFIGCIQPFLRNLRDSRRLISSIAVHLPLHVADGTFEVNIVDFLVLEALRVFEPDLHQALFRDRELVLQSERFLDQQKEADKSSAERLVEVASERRRGAVREALKELFPPLQWVFGGMYYSDGAHSTWLADKRVCSPRYFPQYFELQTTVGELSEHGFVTVLSATSDEGELAAAVADVEANGLLPSLVARFDESVDRLPVESAAVLLPAMFAIGEKFAGAGAVDPFDSPWLSSWRATFWFLKRVPEGIRGPLAIEALRGTEALSIAGMLIDLNDPANRKEGDEETFDPTLDLAAVEAMKAEWLRLIRARAAETGRLAAETNLVSLLYRWRGMAGSSDEPREWMAEALRTDGGFATVAGRMMSRGTTHRAGDKVSTPYDTFSKEAIDDFIGAEVARARCLAIDPAAFPENEGALRVLRRHFELSA